MLEIIWSLIGAFTLAFVTWNYSGARASLVTPVDLSDEYEIEAAKVIRGGYLRRETVRWVTAFLILATGLTGASLPPLTTPTVTGLTGLVLTCAFFIIGILNTLQSYLDLKDRHCVRELLFKSRRFQADLDWARQRQAAG